ncbi:MAG: hypothetical protein WC947_09455 [Elusimicrobiota bacterium]
MNVKLKEKLNVYSLKVQSLVEKFFEHKENDGEIVVDIGKLEPTILGKGCWYGSKIPEALDCILWLLRVMCKRRKIDLKELDLYSLNYKDIKYLKKELKRQNKKNKKTSNAKSKFSSKPKFSSGRRSMLRQFIGFLLMQKGITAEQKENIRVAFGKLGKPDPATERNHKSVTMYRKEAIILFENSKKLGERVIRHMAAIVLILCCGVRPGKELEQLLFGDFQLTKDFLLKTFEYGCGQLDIRLMASKGHKSPSDRDLHTAIPPFAVKILNIYIKWLIKYFKNTGKRITPKTPFFPILHKGAKESFVNSANFGQVFKRLQSLITDSLIEHSRNEYLIPYDFRDTGNEFMLAINPQRKAISNELKKLKAVPSLLPFLTQLVACYQLRQKPDPDKIGNIVSLVNWTYYRNKDVARQIYFYMIATAFSFFDAENLDEWEDKLIWGESENNSTDNGETSTPPNNNTVNPLDFVKAKKEVVLLDIAVLKTKYETKKITGWKYTTSLAEIEEKVETLKKQIEAYGGETNE